MKAFTFQNTEETILYLNEKPTYSHVIFADSKAVLTLSKACGENTILCSTAGEFTSNGFRPMAITGFSYDTALAETVEIQYPPAKSLRALKKAYDKVRRNENAFTLLLCDGLSAMEESIITSFYFTDSKFKIIGGSAGDNLAFKETPIFIGSKRVHSVSIFFNVKTKTQILKENLYVPMGKKLLVTEADPISRVVKSFNQNPAATEYAKALGVSESELSNHFMRNPLGRLLNNEIHIASPMKVNPDKSITFYSQIIPNTFIEVLTPADHTQVINETLSAVKVNPTFALSINCILRSLWFQENKTWSKVNSELLSICKNQTGFISYGEQYYKNHFNQTMVLLLVE